MNNNKEREYSRKIKKLYALEHMLKEFWEICEFNNATLNYHRKELLKEVRHNIQYLKILRTNYIIKNKIKK
jgi:hypothetical protein